MGRLKGFVLLLNAPVFTATEEGLSRTRSKRMTARGCGSRQVPVGAASVLRAVTTVAPFVQAGPFWYANWTGLFPFMGTFVNAGDRPASITPAVWLAVH